VAFLGERRGANRGEVEIPNGRLFHKTLAGQVCKVLLHPGGIAAIGEFGEIVGGNDAELADLGKGVKLGIAQLAGPVALHVICAAGSGKKQLDPLLARERWAVTARGSAGFPVTLVGAFLVTADSF